MGERGPVTEEEFEALREQMDEQARKLREILAEELGGNSDDYQPDRRPVPDGGDSE